MYTPRNVIWPLNIDGWVATFLLKWSLLRGYAKLILSENAGFQLLCSITRGTSTVPILLNMKLFQTSSAQNYSKLAN